MSTSNTNEKCKYHSPLDLSIKNKKLVIKRKDKSDDLLMYYKKKETITIQHIQKQLIIDYNNNSYVNFNNKQYFLKKIDIHINSLHLINGKKYDAEINLYHVNYNNHILIVSILLEKSNKNNKHTKLLTKLFKNLPDKNNKKQSEFNHTLHHLIPDQSNYYVYNGSLLNMCKKVKRVVFDKPIDIHESTFKNISELIEKHFYNLNVPDNIKSIKVDISDNYEINGDIETTTTTTTTTKKPHKTTTTQNDHNKHFYKTKCKLFPSCKKDIFQKSEWCGKDWSFKRKFTCLKKEDAKLIKEEDSLLERLDDIDEKIGLLEKNIRLELEKGQENQEESKKTLLDSISKTSDLKGYDQLLYKELSKDNNSLFFKIKNDILGKIKVHESPEFVKKIADFFVNNKILIVLLFLVALVLIVLSMNSNVTLEKIKTNLNTS